MKTLAEWLQRKPAGPKPKKPLKRTTKPRPMSPKRQRESRVYTQKRKAFLAAHPKCMAWPRILEHVASKPGGLATLPYMADFSSTEIHHMKKPKCKYLNDESTWLAVCRWSHEWIENNKSIARQLGLLI